MQTIPLLHPHPSPAQAHPQPRRRPTVPSQVPPAEAPFPFTISVAADEERLGKAAGMRSEAYGRHMPELREKLNRIEPLDREAGVCVLVAEAKQGGAAVGTIRIQTNQYRPLLIEQAVELPPSKGLVLAELSRLAVSQEPIGTMAKLAIFKATYQYCLLAGIDRLVIGARSPLDRQYRGLLFDDLFPGKGMIPLPYVNNVPHHILFLDIPTAAMCWEAARNPMHRFLVEPNHPDIDFGLTRELTEALQ